MPGAEETGGDVHTGPTSFNVVEASPHTVSTVRVSMPGVREAVTVAT